MISWYEDFFYGDWCFATPVHSTIAVIQCQSRGYWTQNAFIESPRSHRVRTWPKCYTGISVLTTRGVLKSLLTVCYWQQFVTERGNVPLRVADQMVPEAPAPRSKWTRRRPYPRPYKNKVNDTVPNSGSILEDWERRNAPVLNEYVIQPPGIPHFDYERPATSRAQMQLPIHPNDRRRLVERPQNDPHVIRAITTHDQTRIAGAVYHPENDSFSHNRAPLAPLDREGRNYVHRERDRRSRRHATHPPAFA